MSFLTGYILGMASNSDSKYHNEDDELEIKYKKIQKQLRIAKKALVAIRDRYNEKDFDSVLSADCALYEIRRVR